MRHSLILLLSARCLFGQCTPPAINLDIVGHGDSITVGAAFPNYLTDLAGLISSASVVVTIVNDGTVGISWNYAWPSSTNPLTMIQEAPALVDPELARSGFKTIWLIAFAGTNGLLNSLGQHTAETEYANFQQYITARRAAGWPMRNVVVGTMLPRGATVEALRTTYNAYLVAGAATYGYILARFDLDPTMGQAGQNSNTTYYLDGTHPTVAGNVILAGILNTAMYGDTGNPQPFCGATSTAGNASTKGSATLK